MELFTIVVISAFAVIGIWQVVRVTIEIFFKREFNRIITIVPVDDTGMTGELLSLARGQSVGGKTVYIFEKSSDIESIRPALEKNEIAVSADSIPITITSFFSKI